jgi:hypothetical protein
LNPIRARAEGGRRPHRTVREPDRFTLLSQQPGGRLQGATTTRRRVWPRSGRPYFGEAASGACSGRAVLIAQSVRVPKPGAPWPCVWRRICAHRPRIDVPQR